MKLHNQFSRIWGSHLGVVGVFALIALLSANTSFAAADVVERTQVPNSNLALGKTLLGLIFVTAVIYSLAWCVKKFTQGSFMQQNGMRMISAMSLGTKEKAVLIEVENKKILLGVAPGGISRLHVFDSEPASEHGASFAVRDEESQNDDDESSSQTSASGLARSLAVDAGAAPLKVKGKQEFSSYLKDVLNFSAGKNV